MARGWESKSVEEQQAAGVENAAETLRAGASARAHIERQRQDLNLQRERILSERTSSPVRRRALEAALSEVESRLASLA
jgi:hypothetical protein